MKYILATNTMEHPGFVSFVRQAALDQPDAVFLICGDLLNVFPEPGEDAAGSIFSAIYGHGVADELDRLRLNHFRDVQNSPILPQLREIFHPQGRTYIEAQSLASRRYKQVFSGLTRALGSSEMYYIPGNMDYPELSALFSAACPNIFQLDGETVDVGGLRLAGVGGIPSSAQPFGRFTPISPYEMSEAAYESRLASVWGCDVLISHLSPGESPALDAFVRQSPVRTLICRAPFALQEAGNCRGVSRCDYLDDKLVIYVRPFDYPENFAFVVDFSAGAGVAPRLDIYDWRMPDAAVDLYGTAEPPRPDQGAHTDLQTAAQTV